MPTYLIIVPYVPREFRTEWHPHDETGPFSRLQRGHFDTLTEALMWGQKHLNGMPYSVREVPEE